MGLDIHFTEEDWYRVKRDWSAWLAGELDRPMVVLQTYDSFFSAYEHEFTREFMLEKPIGEVLDYYEKRLASAAYYGDSFPKWCPYFGPGIASGFLGGPVTPIMEQRTVWFEVKKPVPFPDLHIKYDPENVWWRRALALTRSAVDRWGDKILIGHTDLGGVLDILASFRTSNQLLVDLYEAPEDVNRLTREIRQQWLRFYAELHAISVETGRGSSCWAPILSPGTTYMHQCDFAYMISPKMFERFVLPDLSACFDQLDHAFYHLDGKGQLVHLDTLCAMDNLTGIQWVPGAGQPPPSDWIAVLKQIRDAGKLCQVFVSMRGARKIVGEIGGRGFDLCIATTHPVSQEEARDFLYVLRDEDISREKRR